MILFELAIKGREREREREREPLRKMSFGMFIRID